MNNEKEEVIARSVTALGVTKEKSAQIILVSTKDVSYLSKIYQRFWIKRNVI